METWWVSRSSSAPVRRSEPKISVHSSNGRLPVISVATLVALGDQLEQQLCAGLRQRHEAELVDDQELVAGHLLLQAQQPALVAGLHQLLHERGCGGEACGEALLAGGQAQAESCVRLAGAA
jgi:hypothetical protein